MHPIPRDVIRLSNEHAVIPAAIRALRPVYRYSVIPGGVYADGELEDAMRKDHAVEQHYSDFDANHLRFVALAADCYRFVSFRQGGRIYWTRRKLRIPKGEILFTDGMHYARTRCGNRLSEQENPGLTSLVEPPAEVLSPPPFRLDNSQLPDSPPAYSQPTLKTDAFSAPEIAESRGDLPLQSGPVIFPNTIPDVITGASPPSVSANQVAAGFLSPWVPLGFTSYGSPIRSTTGGKVPVAAPPVVPLPVPEPDEVIVVAAFLYAIWSVARPRTQAEPAERHIR